MKIDCEGSEYPILLTSRLLERVERIVGEFQAIGAESYRALDPLAQIEHYSSYSVQNIVRCLEQFGFQVSERKRGANRGLFLAARPGKIFAARSTRA